MTISNRSIVVVTKSQVSCRLDTQSVILQIDHGVYFGLDDVGTAIWNHIQSPTRVEEIRDAIVLEYDVTMDRCELDLLNLLQELENHGLIEVRDQAA